MTVLALLVAVAAPAERLPPFAELLAHPVRLKPALAGTHPRLFVTAAGLEALRERARTTHAADWKRVRDGLVALGGPPPPPPGPQARRAQNVVAFAIAAAALAHAVDRDAPTLAAARRWLLAAIDYEPWGYSNNKPNVDLAAGHLLYAVAWAYDLLWHQLTSDERGRVRASLERHARLMADYFSPAPRKRFAFTQNHDFIPTAGLGIAALALIGESDEAPGWAALARAHHQRALALLSPDGYYYEGLEYWIFSAPWLVKLAEAWEHTTGEGWFDRPLFRNWKLYLAHSLLPDGKAVFDFGDIWQGPLTRAGQGEDHARAYPGGRLESNFNVLYRIAGRLGDAQTQAVADRMARWGHTNQEELWTLLWRDPKVAPAPLARLPLAHHFTDSGVVFGRTSWEETATAFAFKAGPPQGHRLAALLPRAPEARLDSGHAHPDAASFMIWAGGRMLATDTGYSGLPAARHHNTITVGGAGQGKEGRHDVWRDLPYTPEGLGAIRIAEAKLGPRQARIVADAAAAYPASAGLQRFRRVFSVRAPGTFTVRDDVRTATPTGVDWYLHADGPFVVDGRRATTQPDPAAGVRLEAVVSGPAEAHVRAGVTELQAPGAPGSIEKGRPEPRGHELVVSSPAKSRHRFEVRLEVAR